MKKTGLVVALFPLVCFAGGLGGGSNSTGSLVAGSNGQALETQGGVTAWRYGSGTGTTSQVNVRDYGAKCDGTTDDTTAINNAIASGAKRVFIPDTGSPCVTTGLSVPVDSASLDAPGLEIIGLGQPEILLTTGLNRIAIDIAKQRFVTIENLKIYSSGTKADTNNTVGIKYEANTSRMVLDNIRIVGFSYAAIQQIQGLVHHYSNLDLRSNTYGISVEKNGATVATTLDIDNAYITSCTRGISADGLVTGHFNRITFESCGSSSTSDGALHLLTGTRGVQVSNIYYESTDGRNVVSTDARWGSINETVIGTPGATNTVTWSGVAQRNRGHYTLTNDTLSILNIQADPDATQDLIVTLARTGAATTGALNFSHSQTAGWRNNANSADLLLGVNTSDQLTFNGSVVGAGSSGVSLQSSFPGVPDTGNANLSGSLKLGADLQVNGSGTFLGTVGATQLTTAYSGLNDRNDWLNLGTTAPAYVHHQIGQLRVQAIATPSAPIATPVGTAGVTTCTYFVACHGPFSSGSTSIVTALSSAGSTSTCNATLSTSNYVAVSWAIPDGASSCDVYKTDSTHLLGNVVAPLASIQDTGQATTVVTAVARNTTADVAIDGQLTATSSGLNVPVVAGATTTQQLIEATTYTLVAGALTPTFTTAFSSAPHCTCTDQTAAAAVKCVATSTVLTIAGTGTDVIDTICVGAK